MTARMTIVRFGGVAFRPTGGERNEAPYALQPSCGGEGRRGGRSGVASARDMLSSRDQQEACKTDHRRQDARPQAQTFLLLQSAIADMFVVLAWRGTRSGGPLVVPPPQHGCARWVGHRSRTKLAQITGSRHFVLIIWSGGGGYPGRFGPTRSHRPNSNWVELASCWVQASPNLRGAGKPLPDIDHFESGFDQLWPEFGQACQRTPDAPTFEGTGVPKLVRKTGWEHRKSIGRMLHRGDVRGLED